MALGHFTERMAKLSDRFHFYAAEPGCGLSAAQNLV
jgi:hypothetical protein